MSMLRLISQIIFSPIHIALLQFSYILLVDVSPVQSALFLPYLLPRHEVVRVNALREMTRFITHRARDDLKFWRKRLGLPPLIAYLPRGSW